MASIEDAMLLLGEVKTGIERLREDFRDEKREAHESRAVIHRRLDEQADGMAGLKTDMALAAVDLAAVKETVEDHKPAVEDWKQMKRLGVGIVGLTALGGLSFGAALIWMGDAAATAVRHWLRIS